MRPSLARLGGRRADVRSAPARPSASPFLRLLAAAVVPAALAAPLALGAQAIESRRMQQTINYMPGDASHNGYENASIGFKYHFGACVGSSIQVMNEVDAFFLSANIMYWYNGRRYQVPSAWAGDYKRLAPGQLDFEATVMFPGDMKTMEMTAFQPTSSSCSGWQHVGPQSALWTENATREFKLEALKKLSVAQGTTKEPLRNERLEQFFQQQIAQARRDSIDKERQAARRADSVRAAAVAAATAAASSANGAGGARSNGPSSTASTTRASGSSTSSGSSSSGNTAADRARQRQADSIAAAQARQQQAEAIRQQIAERQAQQQAQQQQLEQDMQQAVQAGAQLVSGIMQARQEAKERKARQVEAARVALENYKLRMRAEYFQRPAPRNCSASDELPKIKFKQAYSGSLTGAECQMSDSTLAIRYALHLDAPTDVTIDVDANGFYPDVGIRGEGRSYGGGTPRLEAGDYVVTVATRYMGETGSFTMRAKSRAPWGTKGFQISGGYHSASSSIKAPGSAPYTGSGTGGNGRIGWGFTEHVAVVALYDRTKPMGDDGNANQATSIEFGPRLSWQTKWRPTWLYAQYTYGQTTIGKSDPGKGGTIVAGLELFGSRLLSFDVAAQHQSVNFDVSGYKVTYAHTGMLLGMTMRF